MLQTTEATPLNTVNISNAISRHIITTSKHALTARQLALVCYLASLVTPKDTAFQEIHVPIAMYLRIMNKPDTGTERKQLRDSILDLKSKVFWLELERGKRYGAYSWIEKAEVDLTTNTLILKLDDTLAPFLLELQNQARTVFQLGYLASFTHRHTADVYLYATSYKNFDKPVVMPINDAKARFAGGRYSDTYDLKVKCLSPAIKEINEKSDINVEMSERKTGRITTHLIFRISMKKGKALEESEKWKIDVFKKLPKKNIFTTDDALDSFLNTDNKVLSAYPHSGKSYVKRYYK